MTPYVRYSRKRFGKPHRNPREENGLNFSIINALAEAGYNPKGTFLDLETTKWGSEKEERRNHIQGHVPSRGHYIQGEGHLKRILRHKAT